MYPGSRPRNCSGFTLVEVGVAMVMLAAIVVAGIGLCRLVGLIFS